MEENRLLFDWVIYEGNNGMVIGKEYEFEI